MTATYTPGPWLVATSNSWRRIVSQRGDTVCAPCTQPDGHPDLTFPNGGADGPDARLIAAAPDMLEALQMFAACWPPLSVFIDKPEATKALSAAYAAIAKATGTSA